jgi:hypothetical protein
LATDHVHLESQLPPGLSGYVFWAIKNLNNSHIRSEAILNQARICLISSINSLFLSFICMGGIMNKNLKSKWWVDVLLFAGFLAAFFLNLTGLSLHQWIGLAGGLLAVYHLVTHWSWVKVVGARFWGKTSHQARLYYLVDASLLAGFLTILGSGLVISSWLSLSLANYAAWSTLHIGASIATLAALLAKLGLHWRWIAMTARKVFRTPSAPAGLRVSALASAAAIAAAPAPALNRREFLKVMGVVGAASVFALGSSLQGLQDSIQTVQAEPADAEPVVSVEAITPNETATANSSTTAYEAAALIQATPVSALTAASTTSAASLAVSSACVVRCNRGCSFPGRCGRYTDNNANQRCDLGECL